jgi:hypothetical protein
LSYSYLIPSFLLLVSRIPFGPFRPSLHDSDMMDISQGMLAISSSNPHRQCNARSSSSCVTASPKTDMKSGKQQNWNHGPSHLTGPYYTQDFGQGVQQSNSMADEFLHLSTEKETSLSTSTGPSTHVNQGQPGSQVMRSRHNRQMSTEATDGVGETQDSAFLRHIFTQYNTATEMPHLAHASSSAFEVTGEENFSPFENDFREDLYSDAFGSMAPSDLLVVTPNDLSNESSEHGEPMWDRTHDCSSVGTSDNCFNIVSPAALENNLDTWTSQKPTVHVESCSNQRRTCMASAAKMLKSLHVGPMACLCSIGNELSTQSPLQPRMSDFVLTGNRDIEMSVCLMLKCTCSLGPQLQLVLAIICNKLIAWYQAIIRSQSDVSHSTSPSVTNGARNDRIPTEQVLHQPITIGNHFLDVSLESKIKAQVVHNGLQRLEALIEALSRRIKEGKCGALASRSGSGFSTADSSSSIGMDEPGLTEDVQSGLTTYLCRQLQAARTELTNSDETGLNF